MIDIKKYKYDIPEYVKTLFEQTLAAHGGKLFNMLPEDLRGFDGSLDGIFPQKYTGSTTRYWTLSSPNL